MSKRSGPDVIENDKKKRRKIDVVQKQLDDERFIEITTNGRKIHPINIKKYIGWTIERSQGSWESLFPRKYKEKQKTHKTKEDAIAYLKEVNLSKNYVKNMVYKYKNEYYCAIGENQLMKFSIQDLDVVDKYMWCISGDYSGYAQSTSLSDRNKKVVFHQLLGLDMGETLTIDHINRDSLDNRRENLRVASKRTQSINRGVRSTNKSGITGVYDNGEKCIAIWMDENGKQRTKSFSVSIHGDDAYPKAVAVREEMVRTLPHYVLALGNQDLL